MKFSTALLYGLVALAVTWKLSAAYVAIGSAEVIDGKCLFKNVTIEDGATHHSEDPCESWTCKVESATVRVAGCGSVAGGDGCRVVKGHGLYPDCCRRLECS